MLWVLAAYAGRSTRSKGFQQTTRVARSLITYPESGLPTNRPPKPTTQPPKPERSPPKTHRVRKMARNLADPKKGGGTGPRSGSPVLAESPPSPFTGRLYPPSLTVLSRRSAAGLGRSLERPCKWSAALSAV